MADQVKLTIKLKKGTFVERYLSEQSLLNIAGNELIRLAALGILFENQSLNGSNGIRAQVATNNISHESITEATKEVQPDKEATKEVPTSALESGEDSDNEVNEGIDLFADLSRYLR